MNDNVHVLTKFTNERMMLVITMNKFTAASTVPASTVLWYNL